MRRHALPLIALLTALSACSREEDFDEKFKAADAEIQAEVKRLEKQMDAELQREPGDSAAQPSPEK
jgi:uncharacterized protein YcgI (DUF1989 family)